MRTIQSSNHDRRAVTALLRPCLSKSASNCSMVRRWIAQISRLCGDDTRHGGSINVDEIDDKLVGILSFDPELFECLVRKVSRVPP